MLSWKGFLKLTLAWPSLFVMVLKVEDQLYTIGKLQSMCIFGFFSQNTNLILFYPFEIFHPRTITCRRIIAPFWGNCQLYYLYIYLLIYIRYHMYNVFFINIILGQFILYIIFILFIYLYFVSFDKFRNEHVYKCGLNV